MAADKTTLRSLLRTRRREVVAQRGTAIIDVPDGFAGLLGERTVMASYHAVGNEADPRLLARAAAASGLHLSYPHVVDKAQPLRFAIDDARPPVAGPFGLLQPPHDAPDAIPDLVLVPLLGFDARFHRLGQGAGHYDRALAAIPHALRIGIAFTAQEVAELPVDPWDEPLDGIVTEAGLRLNSERRQ